MQTALKCKRVVFPAIVFMIALVLLSSSACTPQARGVSSEKTKKLFNQAKDLHAKLEMIVSNNSWSQQFDDILKTNYGMRFDISPRGDISELNSYEAIKILKRIEPGQLKEIEALQYLKRSPPEPIGIRLNAYCISGEYTDLDLDQLLGNKSGEPFVIAYLFNEKEVLYQMGLFYETDTEWSTYILLKLLS